MRRWYVLWVVAKMLLAAVLSPVILLALLLWRGLFLRLMGALWPHLDIFTPEGDLYLRRWFFWPKFKYGPNPRFLHYIRLSDEGRDPHNHPGAFTTTILWNGYDEEIYFPHGGDYDYDWRYRANGPGRPGNPYVREVRAFETYDNPDGHTHRVKLVGPTLTWVVGWKKGKPWGFWILHPTDASQDRWVDSETYGEKGEERKSWTIDGR